LLSSAAGAVPNLSLQIIWHKHLRKSSCSACYFHPLLRLGLCQTQLAEYWVQLCLCPHTPLPTPIFSLMCIVILQSKRNYKNKK
jgi:hypothetical protein